MNKLKLKKVNVVLATDLVSEEGRLIYFNLKHQ